MGQWEREGFRAVGFWGVVAEILPEAILSSAAVCSLNVGFRFGIKNIQGSFLKP